LVIRSEFRKKIIYISQRERERKGERERRGGEETVDSEINKKLT